MINTTILFNTIQNKVKGYYYNFALVKMLLLVYAEDLNTRVVMTL